MSQPLGSRLALGGRVLMLGRAITDSGARFVRTHPDGRRDVLQPPTWQELWHYAAIDEAAIPDREDFAAADCYAAHFGESDRVVSLQVQAINEGLGTTEST